MRIDTHQHFWKVARGDYGWLTPELESLYRDYTPDDLKPLLEEAGIDGTIAVQAAPTEAETDYLLSLAETNDWIFGVVGWVDLAAEAAIGSIERLAANRYLVGLRPMIQDIPDDAWMLQASLKPAIEAMIEKDLTFDALVMPRHLGRLKAFIECYPRLRIVVDHCAKPEIRNASFDEWAREIADIAATGQVYCKVSGLATEASANWKPEDLRPYIRHVLEVFGPERVIFGSDWPVLNLAGRFADWHQIAADELSAVGLKIEDLAVRSAYPRLQT